MSRPRLDKRGQPLPERVIVHWPGGPYDFELEPQDADWLWPAAKPGWFYVRGLCVKPEGPKHRMMRTLYAERVKQDAFRMIPKEP